jgi:DUF4097 and DUF4098 domain-containing protein YvlB
MSIAVPSPLRLLAGTALTLVLATLSGCVLGQVHLEHETRMLTADQVAAAPVVVRTTNGGVAVTADTTRTDVSIKAELHAQTQDRLARTKVVAAREADGTLRVEIAWADGERLNSEGCDFTILLPDAHGLDIDTSNGAVEVTGLSGNALLRTSNGRITATRQQGDVDARTSNGSITIVDSIGAIKAVSSNGGIDVQNATARVDADTSNGRLSITLASSSPGPVNAETANGSISLTVGASFRGRLSLGTSNSSISTEGLSSRKDAKVSASGKSSATVDFGEGGEPSRCTTSNGKVSVGSR